ncbi:MFS transporter [Actinokineospora fastidiosa]|uniref:MFS transporter n=1 Tax=Actinokineospora fastidiosa TaxID=1816 RepID=A0A918LI62_9PSEU|nr:MFS transporter [Actinokineospora fastidiosa]GGS50039.1 MFS transporter [Actinokineospora fastidiosa]
MTGDYWRLWTSSGLSNLADGVLKVALPLVAIEATRSPVLIAGLAVAFSLPWLLVALPAGAVVDRVDRRVLMMTANLVRAVLVLAIAFGPTDIRLFSAIAFGIGVAEVLHDVAAQSVVPAVVPDEHLSRANGRLYAVELTANEFVGPPLAGFLVAASALAALAVPGGLWIAAVVALFLVRGTFRPERAQRASLRGEVAEGLAFLWRDRVLRAFSVVVGLFNFATSATYAILVLYAVGAMGLDDRGFGWLLAAVAGGSVVGSVAAERVERGLGRDRALVGSLAVAAPLIALPAATANPIAVGAGFFGSGAAIMVLNIVMVSLRQRRTPDRLRGRVTSGHRMVAWGSKPLGALAGGLVGELLGLPAVFLVMGLVAAAGIPVLVRALR